jgi:hypothetical protein
MDKSQNTPTCAEVQRVKPNVLVVPIEYTAIRACEPLWQHSFLKNPSWFVYQCYPKGLVSCIGIRRYDLIVIEPPSLIYIDRYLHAPDKVVCSMEVVEFAQRCKDAGCPTLIISTNTDALTVSGVSVIKNMKDAYAVAVSVLSTLAVP